MNIRDIKWVVKSFNELTSRELYKILHVRQEVFVLELQGYYQDIDYQDQKALHLLGFVKTELVAYTRIFPQNIIFSKSASFGRFLVVKEYRKEGVGHELMEQTFQVVEGLFEANSIEIEAQLYLKVFYEKYGFIMTGNSFINAGIPHIIMKKDL
ncbi:GNAT family N-acetyltransferase [Bacteroides sp.]|uniref:GNAT family N-acetyltransferase n=1 Tax=Bacteroides sp. TaxID=29523 RepID=UPI0025828F7F|nr:GNAT family N-acetyltransferase [Bacteroides sp.]